MENLSTSKITGGRRRPLRSRRKYEINRYPNEALLGEQVTGYKKSTWEKCQDITKNN